MSCRFDLGERQLPTQNVEYIVCEPSGAKRLISFHIIGYNGVNKDSISLHVSHVTSHVLLQLGCIYCCRPSWISNVGWNRITTRYQRLFELFY